MTQSTDDRRLDLPGGYYIRQGKPDDMVCSLHMADDLYIGDVRAEYAGDFAAAMAALPAPAPAPAPATIAAEIRQRIDEAAAKLKHGDIDDKFRASARLNVLRECLALAEAALPAPHAPKEEPPAPVDLAAKIRALMADAIEHGRKLWLANEWEQFGLFEQQIAALQECLDRVEAALPAPHVPKQEPAAPAKDTP